jgi:hypothetical protein
MTLIITGVGSLIHIFSVGYMQEDPGYARYFAYLNLFVFFMLVLALAVLTGGLDEAHQATTPTREGRVVDVLLDGAAAAAALVVATVGTRRAADGLAWGLLWAAAGGGTVMLAIDLAAAAPSGWLWLSVPAAWLTLWLWRRRRARA